MIGTHRRESLDHVIPLNERHLRTLLAEYVGRDNLNRPHRKLRLEAPAATGAGPRRAAPAGLRTVRAQPVLNRLYHVYERPA